MATESRTTTARRAASPYPAGIEIDHLNLIRALAELTPHRIIGNADAADFQNRADHLRGTFAAVERYANAVMADTASNSTGLRTPIGRNDITDTLQDTVGDLAGAIERAADDCEGCGSSSSRTLVRLLSEIAR
jgi:hypothetical protein